MSLPAGQAQAEAQPEARADWTDSTDVVVVGGGGSGLACAAAAAEAGLKVVVLEKQSQLGGTTGIAIGSFTANRTRLQRRAGIEDSAEDHQQDAGKFGPEDYQQCNNHPLRQFFLRHASDTLDWLEGLGLAFHGPYPEPPNRVARMHNVAPNAKAYIATLQGHLLRHQGVIRCDAEVTSLRQEEGRVNGVCYQHDGQTRYLKADVGVVLAAGDYASSTDLIAEHRGEEFSQVEGINPHAMGDGHRLGASVGGQLVNMHITYGPELRFVPAARQPFTQLMPTKGWPMRAMAVAAQWCPRWILSALIKRLLVTWQHPEDSLFEDGAILVNRAGRRFCNELDSPSREISVSSQEGKRAYLLLDERLIDRYSRWPHFISTAPKIAYAYVRDYLRLRPDVAVRGTLGQVAGARNIPAGVLEETVRDFASSVDDPFDRSSLRRLEGQTWVLLGPVKSYFTTTEGGLSINEQLEALDQNGTAIPGLYAVGQNGLGGMVLFGHGLHIAWAITSGRLLGQRLAKLIE